MDIKNISEFLDKFKNILSKGYGLRDVIIVSVKDITGLDIKIEKIKISNDTAFIKTSPVIKSEIYLKKEKILQKINSNFKYPVLKDIR